MARKYELKRRAERQEETRQRIVDAAVALHEQEGPARTTISAIAERAGVERPTVYRHFPDLRSLFTACTTSYRRRFPVPDPDPWRSISNPETRLRHGLAEVYAYYSKTENMIARAQRDVADVPELAEVLGPYFAKWDEIKRVLEHGWPHPDANRVSAAIALAIAFPTWKLLVRDQRLSPDAAIELMNGMVGCPCTEEFSSSAG